MAIKRVEITKEAADVLARLKDQHGALMFHQSGGCCDGSSPMCYPQGDFRVGPQDVLLGEIAACPFYIGAAAVVLGIVILSTAHGLLGEAERNQAAAAEAALAHGPASAEAKAERELEAEERAEALSGDAD